MTTILFFFWDGFGGEGGATLVGAWSSVIPCRSDNARMEVASMNQRLIGRTNNQCLEVQSGNERISVRSRNGRVET
jgi:hypothetical protein